MQGIWISKKIDGSTTLAFSGLGDPNFYTYLIPPKNVVPLFRMKVMPGDKATLGNTAYANLYDLVTDRSYLPGLKEPMVVPLVRKAK